MFKEHLQQISLSNMAYGIPLLLIREAIKKAKIQIDFHFEEDKINIYIRQKS